MTTDSHVLLLWGDTQVGKTTLLTTAFYNPTIGEIDREESAQSISTLFQGLRDLSNQRLTKPTVVFHYDVELKMKSGKHVVRDIKGGITRTVDEESVRERLKESRSALSGSVGCRSEPDQRHQRRLGSSGECA